MSDIEHLKVNKIVRKVGGKVGLGVYGQMEPSDDVTEAYGGSGEEVADDVAETELRERSNMAARLTDLRRVLRTGLAQFPKLRDAAIEALNPPPETGAKGLLFLGPLLISDFRAMVRNRRLARELKTLMLSPEAKQARPVIKETLDLLKQQSRLERRLSQAEAVRDFMDTWRALHLIMAVIVLATMFLHVYLSRFAV